MRSPDEFRFARLTRGLLTVSLTALVAACGGSNGLEVASTANVPAAQRANDPSADFPIRVGEPYFVGDTEYVPADTMNYDHVGYATMDEGAMGYSGAHHTLPLPSYVEVTALDSGRTILVRLERRGPMESTHLVALSPAALAQLGIGADAPVRVRRTVPPEDQRFMLRAGQAAPLRMDTPRSLLTVLQRRLPAEGTASLRAATAPPTPIDMAVAAPAAPVSSTVEDTIARVELPPSTAASAPPPVSTAIAPAPPARPAANDSIPALPPLEQATVASAPAEEQPSFNSAFADVGRPGVTEQAPAPTPLAQAEGGFVVQAAAFSTRDRAERAANVLGGFVTPSGRYFRVRTGPFATRGEAEASLANVRRAGYTDARIFTNS